MSYILLEFFQNDSCFNFPRKKIDYRMHYRWLIIIMRWTCLNDYPVHCTTHISVVFVRLSVFPYPVMTSTSYEKSQNWEKLIFNPFRLMILIKYNNAVYSVAWIVIWVYIPNNYTVEYYNIIIIVLKTYVYKTRIYCPLVERNSLNLFCND